MREISTHNLMVHICDTHTDNDNVEVQGALDHTYKQGR